MIPSIPRRGGLRKRTEPSGEFQGGQVISKSTVPLNRHATPHRFSIPTPKQQETTQKECPHITHVLPSSTKRNKTERKRRKIERKIETTYKHMIEVCMNIITENTKKDN